LAPVPLSPAIEFTRVASASERIKPGIIDTDAVLKAVDEWVTAQEALVAAQRCFEETEAEEEGADIAGAKLVVTVKRWRAQIMALAEENTQLKQSRAG
jgi:hypothetical protein